MNNEKIIHNALDPICDNHKAVEIVRNGKTYRRYPIHPTNLGCFHQMNQELMGRLMIAKVPVDEDGDSEIDTIWIEVAVKTSEIDTIWIEVAVKTSVVTTQQDDALAVLCSEAKHAMRLGISLEEIKAQLDLAADEYEEQSKD